MDRLAAGHQLRQLRVELGLRQQQVADRCGISQSHVAAYEAGRRPISPTQESKIRRALRRPPSEVLTEHKDDVRRIASRYGADQVSVFGSIARGEDRFDSDVDLLVTLRPGVGLFDLATMRDEIEAVLGVPVDIISAGGLKSRDTGILREAVPL